MHYTSLAMHYNGHRVSSDAAGKLESDSGLPHLREYTH